jgi:hypothetical protein
MKRKIALFGVIFLALVVLMIWAIPVFPVFAADGPGETTPATQCSQGWHKMKILGRLLLIQDEAKVDALIAKAVEADKLTDEQAVKVKDFWTNHHQQFGKKVFLTRLIWVEDGAKVQAFLDKAEAAGKISTEQAEKIMSLWEKLHAE